MSELFIWIVALAVLIVATFCVSALKQRTPSQRSSVYFLGTAFLIGWVIFLAGFIGRAIYLIFSGG